METKQINIKSADGAEITASLFRVKTHPSDKVFIVLPAMGVKAAYYKPLAEQLTRLGHDVMLCDLRGQGTSNRKAPKAKFGYREILELDMPAYVKAARKHCPDKTRLFLGHSLGGHLSLMHAATRPAAVSALAIVASGSVYYKAYAFPQNLKIWFGTQSSVFLSTLFGYFPGHKLGFGGKQPKRLMEDWARQGRTGQFAPTDSDLNYEEAMVELDLPVFALSLDDDKFAPHSATDHLVSKLKQAKLTRIRFTSSPQGPKVDHFRWVKDSEDILNPLTKWLETL